MALARGLEKDISAVNVVQLMMSSRVASRFVVIASLAAVYFVAGKIGLQFATIHPSATAIWAPTGIALSACLKAGTMRRCCFCKHSPD